METFIDRLRFGAPGGGDGGVFLLKIHKSTLSTLSGLRGSGEHPAPHFELQKVQGAQNDTHHNCSYTTRHPSNEPSEDPRPLDRAIRTLSSHCVSLHFIFGHGNGPNLLTSRHHFFIILFLRDIGVASVNYSGR